MALIQEDNRSEMNYEHEERKGIYQATTDNIVYGSHIRTDPNPPAESNPPTLAFRCAPDVLLHDGSESQQPRLTSHERAPAHRVGMPIFKNAPTTSTSSHLDSLASAASLSAAAAAAAFFVWMYRSELRK